MSNDRVEASMPVQSRIDIRVLAELLTYWDNQGYYISNMSRLVSWSLEALREVLVMNSAIGNKVSTLEDAYEVLKERGVLQKSMEKKMDRKLFKAMGLESVRLGGGDVDMSSEHFRSLHGKGAVEPYPDGASRSMMSDEEREKLNKHIAATDARRREKDKERRKGKQRDNSPIFDKETMSFKDGVAVDVEGNMERAKAVDDSLDEMP